LGAVNIIMIIPRSDLLGLIDNVPSNFGTRITSIHSRGGKGLFHSMFQQKYLDLARYIIDLIRLSMMIRTRHTREVHL